MPATALKQERNQSVELCRLAAAALVVFIHAPLPDPLGGWVSCLARIAVPFFFAISGYFILGRDSTWISRRLVNLLKLNMYTSIPYFLWKYWAGWRGVGLLPFLREDVFPRGWFMGWFLRHENPAAGHLWYLAAMVPCYLGLWLYEKFREGESRKPLYLTGFFLLILHFLLSALLPAGGIPIPYPIYRNGWLMGAPLFLLGMFLREYGQRIIGKFRLTTRKLLLLMAAGIGLSVLQWRSDGLVEMFLGTIPELVALVLLLGAHPVLPSFLGRLAPRLGRVSTVVYVMHLLILELYESYIQGAAEVRFPRWESWLQPFLVLAASLAVGFFWEWVCRLWRERKKA